MIFCAAELLTLNPYFNQNMDKTLTMGGIGG